MTAPILVACLVTLRAEFNRLAPARDKGADGWIGDAAHQQESSDHNPDETGRTPTEDPDNVNEVHALDIDKDLGAGQNLDDHVERVRLNHLRGDDDRLQNIIWRGQIASRSWGWTWRPYSGASKHFDHAHFSARYTAAQESDTSYWGVCMNPDDIAKIAKASSYLTITALTNALRNEKSLLAATMRAIPWQYGVGVEKAGLPVDNTSMLATITNLWLMLHEIEARTRETS